MTLLYRLVRNSAWLGYKIVGRTRVIGHRNIPTTGPVILASNHVSFLDPPLVGANVWRECAFMARHDLWRNKLMGALITRLNAFPVHRDTADRAALKHAIHVLRRGLVLVLFPEGTRSTDGMLQAPQPGLALIVQRTGAPVVPTVVVGPEVMLPVGARRLKRCRLQLVFGEPLRFPPTTPREEVLATIMRAIADLLTVHRPELPPGPEHPRHDG